MREISTPNTSLEYRAAVASIIWGLWLMMGNETTLDAKAFEYLRETWTFGTLQPRFSLGFTALTFGLIYAGSVRINGHGITWTPIVRMLCSGFNSALFSSVAYSISHSDFWSPGVVAYGIIAAGFFTLFYQNIPRASGSISILWSRFVWIKY